MANEWLAVQGIVSGAHLHLLILPFFNHFLPLGKDKQLRAGVQQLQELPSGGVAMHQPCWFSYSTSSCWLRKIDRSTWHTSFASEE